VYGPRAAAYGHVLPLALGFPLETTVAVARMLLAGVFDAVRDLEVILAHSGGTLPFLAGRIESCVAHDEVLSQQGKLAPEKARRTVWDVLRENIYLDAVVYGGVGVRAAVGAGGEKGVERVMFGTDHPFFPPLESEEGGAGGEQKWLSVQSNLGGVERALGGGSAEERLVLGGNAVRILNLNM